MRHSSVLRHVPFVPGIYFFLGMFLLGVPSFAAPPQTTPTTQPDTVDPLLTALHGGDFKQVFGLCSVYQTEVGRIHGANPQVLWPKLEADYFAAEQKRFLTRNVFIGMTPFYKSQIPIDVVELAEFLSGNESHTVSEKRADKADEKPVTVNFVSVKFSDEIAPWLDGKLLKETMLKVTTDVPSNHFLFASRIKEADVYRDSLPLRIYSVQQKRTQGNADPLGMHGGNTYKMSLGVYVLGGKPPYHAIIRVPGLHFKLSKDGTGENMVVHSLGEVSHPNFDQAGFLDDCLASVTDSNGDTDIGRFSARGVTTDIVNLIDHSYIRKPWFDMGPVFGDAMEIDWANASSLTTDGLKDVVKEFDRLDALKRLEVGSRKETSNKDFFMLEFIAYPGLWSNSFSIGPNNKFTKWQVSHDVIVSVGGTEYRKPPVPLKQGDRLMFKPAGDAPIAVTLIEYYRNPTAKERTADLPLLPEPVADTAK